jgi:hypothetical protein
MSKVLIAEDDCDTRDLITCILRFADHEVIAARNGEEAVSLARQEIPDLILMDVRMPRLTGYEACAAIKLETNLVDIPVVFSFSQGPGGRDPSRSSGWSCGVPAETVRSRPIDWTDPVHPGTARKLNTGRAAER